MAFKTATVTGRAAFWADLKAFLMDGPELAPAERWTQAWAAPIGAPNESDILLRGPGLSGTDEIYVGLSLYEDPAAGDDGLFGLDIRGAVGVNVAAQSIADHVNVSHLVSTTLDESPMTYWFVGNARRFAGAVKIATTYHGFYGGLILPYAPPAAYPYPLFVGGTIGLGKSGDSRKSFRSDDAFMRVYPYCAVSGSRASTCSLLDPFAQWKVGVATSGSGSADTSVAPTYWGDPANWPIAFNNSGSLYGHNSLRERMRTTFDGGYPLTPITLGKWRAEPQTWGILDGIYHVPGFQNTPENIVTIGGIDHLVLQDVARREEGDFWAMKLE